MAKSKVKLRRFYRGKGETMVWDPENECVLVDFLEQEVKGTFTTDDPRTQKILDDLGYIEVGLDQQYPPELPPDPLQEGEMADVKPLPAGVTEEVVLAKQKAQAKREAALKKPKVANVEDEHGPAVDPPKNVSSKEKPKREIKRRKKK